MHLTLETLAEKLESHIGYEPSIDIVEILHSEIINDELPSEDEQIFSRFYEIEYYFR